MRQKGGIKMIAVNNKGGFYKKGGGKKKCERATVTELVMHEQGEVNYIVTSINKRPYLGSSITVSRSKWKGGDFPKPGNKIYLHDIVEAKKGFRSLDASFRKRCC